MLNQGLRQLFLTVSWDLCSWWHTPEGVSVSLWSRSTARGEVEGPEECRVSLKSTCVSLNAPYRVQSPYSLEVPQWKWSQSTTLIIEVAINLKKSSRSSRHNKYVKHQTTADQLHLRSRCYSTFTSICLHTALQNMAGPQFCRQISWDKRQVCQQNFSLNSFKKIQPSQEQSKSSTKSSK